MKIKVKKLHKKAQIPKYQTSGSAGFDLHALQDTRITPGECTLISTGLAFEIPEGYEMQIRPRSGMSYKTKLRIANSPGTIDSDYRGEVKIIAENTGKSNHLDQNIILIKAGDRIAQAVISPILQVEFDEITDLSNTERGDGGFGSTNE